MRWVRRNDLTDAEFDGLVSVWRALRDAADRSDCECFRSATAGRVWYPLTEEADRRGEDVRLNELQQQLVEQLGAIAARLDVTWSTVAGLLRAEMAAEDSVRKLPRYTGSMVDIP